MRRIAIVTGASRRAGIGAAIAAALAADGWDLLLTGYAVYDDASNLASEDDGLPAVAEFVASSASSGPGGAVGTSAASASTGPGGAAATTASSADSGVRVETLEADLADPDAPDRILDACHARLGPPTALVNNAAVSARGDLLTADAAELDRHWAVNARAPILLTAAFARRFEGDAASVVNMTSGQSVGAMPGEIAYAASKGALEAFTLQAAAELAPRGIRVNAVDPGPTDTGWMTAADRTALAAPLGGVGTPEDAARLVRFLCSEDGRWITGQVLRSRGGL